MNDTPYFLSPNEEAKPTKGGFRVPLGVRGDGRVVSPAQAASGDAVACPACRGALLVRGGEGKSVRRHFAHKPDAECAEETVLHRAAKLLVQQVLTDSLTGEGPPVDVVRVCCYDHCKKEFQQPLRLKGDRIVLEHRLSSGRVADVAMLAGESVLAIVEICVTHAVDAAKREDIAGISCAELHAQEVIENPYVWRPNADLAKPIACPDCKQERRRLRDAGVPRWMERYRHSDDNIVSEVLRTGRLLQIWERYDGGTPRLQWEITKPGEEHSVVALLGQEVSAKEWRASAGRRAQWVSERRAKFPDLPRFVDLYWAVLAAVEAFGGSVREDVAGAVGEGETSPFPSRLVGLETGATTEQRWAKVQRIARSTGQLLPDMSKGNTSPYWVEPFRCYAWQCREEMLVYTWRGHRWMTRNRPPEPVPPTLQFRNSATAGDAYWGNTCPSCGRLQGENFVYAPDGPLQTRSVDRGSGASVRDALYHVFGVR